MDSGIRAIDSQQHALIERFEKAHTAGHSAQALTDVLPQLETYAPFHFDEEVGLVGEYVFVASASHSTANSSAKSGGWQPSPSTKRIPKPPSPWRGISATG